jgi:glycosyltransferase involved in cell wall biosynthesis
MNNSKAKLTVIIPTKNRAETLVYALKTVTCQPNENIEILVSDNFSEPDVKNAVDSISDKRIRYIRTSEPLGMSEHYNFAIEHATGEWVTIIGDDDGLLIGSIDNFFKLTEKHPDIKAITAVNCSYLWPVNAPDRLVVNNGSGYEIRSGLDCLRKTMYGTIINLPTIYTGGYVKKELIDEIKEKSPEKKFFQSINPDLYSGMAVSSVIDNYIYSFEPLAISGTSKHSNGYTFKNKNLSELSKFGLFNEGTLRFIPTLGNGAVEAMQILLYESFLRCSHLRKDDMGTTLEQQLALSMLLSTKRVIGNVEEYCRWVAQLNNLDFNKVLKIYRRKKPIFKGKKVIKKLFRHIPCMDKRNRKTFTGLGLNNVYEAAVKIDELINTKKSSI